MKPLKNLINKHIFYRSPSIHTIREKSCCAKILKVYPLHHTMLIMLKNEYQTQLITKIPTGYLNA